MGPRIISVITPHCTAVVKTYCVFIRVVLLWGQIWNKEAAMADLNNHGRFPSFIQFRAPEKLPDVIAAAADKKFTTEFVDQRKKLFAERLDRVAIVLLLSHPYPIEELV